MWHGARIAVVVPAYREEKLIGRTLAAMPPLVDWVIVVDDASPDDTWNAISRCADPRILPLRHADNRGVGAAIVSGYQRALDQNADVMVVMAGDAQMDPNDLELLLEPVVLGRAAYAKGNRFQHPAAKQMPRMRRWAGRGLAWITRQATGLGVNDTQCGYTALSAQAARRLRLNDLWPRFGYPNDLLGMLAAERLPVVEVPVRPVYADESSGIRPWHVLSIAGVIARRWWRSGRHAGSAPVAGELDYT